MCSSFYFFIFRVGYIMDKYEFSELSDFIDRCTNIDYIKNMLKTLNEEIKSISNHKQLPSLTALAYASKLRVSSDVAFERKLLPLYQQKHLWEVKLKLVENDNIEPIYKAW